MKKKDGMMAEHDFNEYEDEILRELPARKERAKRANHENSGIETSNRG